MQERGLIWVSMKSPPNHLQRQVHHSAITFLAHPPIYPTAEQEENSKPTMKNVMELLVKNKHLARIESQNLPFIMK
jgi:hypothetical protein